MKALRRASVAGTWYPGNPSRLAADLDRYLAARCRRSPLRRPLRRDRRAPRGVDVFRARGGLCLQPGARHAVHRRSCSSAPRISCRFRASRSGLRVRGRRRLAPVAVDGELSAAIPAESPDIIELPAAHGREHSLEMQLPFVAHLFPGVPIVPLVMGRQTRDTAFALGAAMARRPRARGRTCCWSPAATCRTTRMPQRRRALDASSSARRGAGCRRPDERARAEPRHACGGGPMVAVLDAAGGSARPRHGCYSTPTPATCQATSRRSSVTWPRRYGESTCISDRAESRPELTQHRLLALATTRTRGACPRRDGAPAHRSQTCCLDLQCGVFVSILQERRAARLPRPARVDCCRSRIVVQLAQAVADSDPRFDHVTPRELAEIGSRFPCSRREHEVDSVTEIEVGRQA